MAEVTQTGYAGQVYSDIISGGSIPQELRKEGIDEAAKLTYLTRDIAVFTYMMHKNFKSALKVKDRKYLVREISELGRFYTTQLDTTGTAGTAAGMSDPFHQIIALSNFSAAELQPEVILFNMSLYATVTTQPLVYGQVIAGQANGTSTGTGNVGPDFKMTAGGLPTGIMFSRNQGYDSITGLYFNAPEQMKILAVGQPDSAGIGLSWIKLQRCYFGPGETDDGGAMISQQLVNISITTANIATPTIADVRVNDRLIRATPCFKEGTQAPNGVYKNPTKDSNFTQEFKYAFELTKESEIVTKDMWIDDDPLTINRWLISRQMNRDREYAALFGRKGRFIDGKGKEENVSGGVIPFIRQDQYHYIQFPNAAVTWPALLKMGAQMAKLGGGSERWVLTGITMDAELRASFWGQQMVWNKQASDEFKMEVNTIYMCGMKVNIIASQVMEETGFGNVWLCLDMTQKDAFEPVTHIGWDYKVDNNNGLGIQEPGLQTYKEQILGIFGMKRRYSARHCLVTFVNSFAAVLSDDPNP